MAFTEKKKSFMANVALVMLSQIAVKLLGMVYRVVITNISGFGDLGSGYLNTGFQIYTLLLAVSSVGIPNAIAKMTSERNAVGDYRGAHKIFRSAMILFAIVGAFSSGMLYFGADFITKYIIGIDGTQYVLKCLAPSVLFVCLSSVIRGYFSGMENMKATSNSQVFEQFFKCTLTILIVYTLASFPVILEFLLSTQDIDADTLAVCLASGSQVATTLATVISFLYLLVFYGRRRGEIMQKLELSSAETITKPLGQMFKSILMISIPISLGSIISAVNRIIDTATIARGLCIAFADMIPAYGSVAAILNPTATQLSSEAARLSGQLSKSDTLVNLPLSVNIAFSTVLVPVIAGALKKGDRKTASDKISYSFMISMLIALPCAVGYIALAKPIYALLYPNAQLGSDLLQISAIAMIFTALNQTLSGSLQGAGKIFTPAKGLFMGCVAKFILNVILIRRPEINIYGAPISSIVCQIISFCYSFNVLKKCVNLKLPVTKCVTKPIICSLVMGVCAYILYALSIMIFKSNLISVPISIVLAAIIYGFMVLKLAVLSEDDVLQLPMGAKILKILKKLKFYK